MSFTEAFSSLLTELHFELLPKSLKIILGLSPLLLVLVLGYIFFDIWVRYVQATFILKTKRAVLEIRLPKEINKSPLAMEVFLNALHNSSDGNLYKRFWNGEGRPWYSLELASVEGRIKFYIWTEDKRKAGVMSALYSQFPGIEVIEREDYSLGVQYDPETMKMWAEQFELTKPDPYPIKTYIDYGLDKDPKEEFKIDPITPMLEFLGSVGPNQQVWIQIMIRAHKKSPKAGHLFKQTDRWKDEAADIVNEMLKRDPKTRISGEENEEGTLLKAPTLTKSEQEVINSIERSLSKQAFDVGIRAIYMAKKDFFNTPFGIGGIIGSFKHFSTEHLNGFKPAGTWLSSLEYPWQDYKDIRRTMASNSILSAYKRRSFFYPPYKGKPIVLNGEELATIYHFPGAVAGTPTLDRVESKKSQAPSNLPI